MLPSLRAAGACRFAVYIALSSTALTACEEHAVAPHPPQMVRAVVVKFADYVPTVALTGEIRPQVERTLAFRVGGRVAARNVDVGDHVNSGDVLASLDAAELMTSVGSASAAVDAAEAQFKQAASAFARQEALLASGFTTRRAYDQADEGVKASRAALDGANADLKAALDQLDHTELRSVVSGVVTVRNVEVGQVVPAAQPVFTIAGDGARDAVFNVNETIFARQPKEGTVVVSLVSDPDVKASGTVREVSPTLSAGMGTVVVKVGLSHPPQSMDFGSSVSGIARFQSEKVITLPWQALSSSGGAPAVWIADPATKTVSLRPVSVDRYDAGRVLIRDGLTPGETVVTAGAQLLRPGQLVELADGADL